MAPETQSNALNTRSDHLRASLSLLLVFAVVLLSPVLYDLFQVVSAAPGA